MKIAVLGNNGMLGWMMQLQLSMWKEFDVMGFNRSDFILRPFLNPEIDFYTYNFSSFDYIVNCIGAIKPMFSNKSKLPINIFVNSIFPHILANYGKKNNIKIIHITTDCVFDGKDGQYTESAQHNPLDEYGKTKSLGEPENCMVIRTSIIGPEIRGRQRSLIENVKKNDGGKMFGYINHWWNGLTTKELSILIGDIIESDLYADGTFHLFSNDVTKFEMIDTMIGSWGFNIELSEKETKEPCNRTLRTDKQLNSILMPKSYIDMIEDLSEYV